MATSAPQNGHARPKPTTDEPATVDELLDVAAEDTVGNENAAAPVEEAPAPLSVAHATPAPAQVGGTPKPGPGKKVGVGVAITAVVFALSWAFRRKRRHARV